jgi:hypothetical protein
MSFRKSWSDIISIGQTTNSSPVKLNDMTLFGLTTGSSLTGTTLTFLVSNDNVTYYPLFNKNGEVSCTSMGGALAKAIALTPSDFLAWTFVKVVEGTSASGVAQATANCLITFYGKSV